MVSYNETDFDEDQHPPAEDGYKQLEDRLSAMEVQKVPGLDFGDLGLSSGVVIPHKFKAPIFAKYDGGPLKVRLNGNGILVSQHLTIHVAYHPPRSYKPLTVALIITFVVEHHTLDERIMRTISSCIPKLSQS